MGASTSPKAYLSFSTVLEAIRCWVILYGTQVNANPNPNHIWGIDPPPGLQGEQPDIMGASTSPESYLPFLLVPGVIRCWVILYDAQAHIIYYLMG